MTEEELTARLRRTIPEYLKGILSSDDVESDLNEAADAIAELRRELDEAVEYVNDADARAIALTDENTAMKERIARLEAALRDAKAFHDRDSGCNGFTADYEILRHDIDAALDVKEAG